MTSKHVEATLRVAYRRDVMKFPSVEVQVLKLSDALHVAIGNHRPGEFPVIIGTKLQLIGIEAIRAARKAINKK